MNRVRILAGHLAARAPPPVRPFPVAGDEEDPDDDELAELLAAQALGLDEDEEEEDILGLDEPSEAELLEQLQEPNPHPAVSALRQLWREQEGPFAADELDAAMSHLRARVTDHKSAVKAIERCIAALKDVVAEYPNWAEPLNELATCYLLQANPEQSNRTADQVLELQPAHFDCLARMCLACAIMGDDDRAEEAAGKLEKVCPALARPIRDLVKGLSEAVKKARSGQAGDEPQAIALEIDPETLETLGPILQGMGGFGDAMQGLGGGGDDLGDLGPLFDGDDQEGDLVPGADDDLDDFELEFETDDDSSGRLADGSEVSLTGLESFPEYNGMVGTIREWDEGRQRCAPTALTIQPLPWIRLRKHRSDATTHQPAVCCTAATSSSWRTGGRSRPGHGTSATRHRRWRRRGIGWTSWRRNWMRWRRPSTRRSRSRSSECSNGRLGLCLLPRL